MPSLSESANLINEHCWLPFTPNRDFRQQPKLFTRAKGVYYYDARGRPIIDGVSGLFTSALGHGRDEITQAITAQLQTLDFTASFYRSHPGAFACAKALANILPERLKRIFWVSSGSEAVDSALKIALAYHRARKQASKTLFISRQRAYHGVNFGGVALSGLANNHRQFAGGWPQCIHIRHTWLAENRFSLGQPAQGAYLADDLLNAIQLYGAENIAACVIEPIAGSTGILIPPKGYLERLRHICDQHDILLIMDEVICGFGRTGKAFASQTFNVRADMLTLAKALTNGVQPMGAVAVDQHIYDTIINAGEHYDDIEFFHGYTWSGHPVACAAALATLHLYQQYNVFAQGESLSRYFLQQLITLRELPIITDIRGFGLLGGIDLKPSAKAGATGYRLQKQLFDHGLHVKSTGDTLLLAPILVADHHYIDELLHILRRVLSAA